jgi:glycosyltransferase involved in cell wall biosynthesis
MRVSGCTILRNAQCLGYPFLESLRSLLPLVDELVVNVGDSQDETRSMVESLGDPRIRIVDTVWDLDRPEPWTELSRQTNRVLAECTGDWIVYLQADEVLHERDYDRLRRLMARYLHHRRVLGFSFEYLHFYYSPWVIHHRGYRAQVRIVRNGVGIRSVGDAGTFYHPRWGKLRPWKRWALVRTGCFIYHYGYVRPRPDLVEAKQRNLERFFRSEAELRDFRMEWDFRLCTPFRGDHPAVMGEFIRRCPAEAVSLPRWPLRWRPLYWGLRLRKFLGI